MKTDYEIRQETEKDYPQVFKLVEEAFRDMEESVPHVIFGRKTRESALGSLFYK